MKKYILLFAFVFFILALSISVYAEDDNYKMISPIAVTTNNNMQIMDGGWALTQQTPDTYNPLTSLNDIVGGGGKFGTGMGQIGSQRQQYFSQFKLNPNQGDTQTIDDSTFTYDDSSSWIEYDFDWGQTNIYLYRQDGSQDNIDLFNDDNGDGTWTFGATDNNQDGDLHNYTYYIQSTDNLRLKVANDYNDDGNITATYPVFSNNHNGDEAFTGVEHDYNFEDICNQTYSNCQWSLGEDGLSAVITFTSDGNIDPLTDPVTTCGEIDSSGYYHLTSNLTSTGTCITINSSNVILDGDYNVISFNTAKGTPAYGIYLVGNQTNETIENFNYINYSMGNPPKKSVAIYEDSNLNYSTITNNVIFLNGSNGAGINIIANSSYNNFTSNNITNINSDGILITTTQNDNYLNNFFSGAGGIYDISSNGLYYDDNIINNAFNVTSSSLNFAPANLINCNISYNNMNGGTNLYMSNGGGSVLNMSNNIISYNNFTTNSNNILIGKFNLFNNNFINNSIHDTGNSNNGFYISNGNATNNLFLNNNFNNSGDNIVFQVANSYSNNFMNNILLTRAASNFDFSGGYYNYNDIFLNNSMRAYGNNIFGSYMYNESVINNFMNTNVSSIYLAYDNQNCVFINNTINSNISFIYSTSSNNFLNNNKLNSSAYDLYIINNVTNLTLYNQNIINYFIFQNSSITFINSSSGIISLTNINGSGTDLIGDNNSDIQLNNNFAYVNSSQTGLNQSANITFYNISFTPTTILRDGVTCPVGICSAITNLGGNSYGFSVTGWSNYSLSASSPTPPIPISVCTSFTTTMTYLIPGFIALAVLIAGGIVFALGFQKNDIKTILFSFIIIILGLLFVGVIAGIAIATC